MSSLRDQEWLEDALHALDLVCFDGHLPPIKIVWHRFRGKKRPRVGDYLNGRIRVSRTLQDHRVPNYFVLWVIYHEALHSLLGHEHSQLFLTTEKQFPKFAEAQAWEMEHWDVLMELQNGRS